MYSMAKKTPSVPQAALPSVKKSARWNSRIIEKCLLMSGIDSQSVPNILQQPFGGQLAAQSQGARPLVHVGGEREELHALQVPALRPGDVGARKAPALCAARHVL